MPTTLPAEIDLVGLDALYEHAEQEYFKTLPLEHFMESTSHATQRKITVESFDLIRVSRPDVQCFNELLVQYPLPGFDVYKPTQVVPDNMVVIHPDPIVARGSFNTPLQPVGPFLVLEYVSKNSKEKDYVDNYSKYESELKVPYYLLFYHDDHDLTLFKLMNEKYVKVEANEYKRHSIPELDLEVALHEGWMRYWYRGELLPLPGDLLQELNDTKNKLNVTQTKLNVTQTKLNVTQQQLNSTASFLDSERLARASLEAELIKLREELARAKPQS